MIQVGPGGQVPQAGYPTMPPGPMHLVPHGLLHPLPPPPIAMNWSIRPFSHEEHSAFLDAMERYGQESTGNEWEKIAQAVGNRSAHEVRMHAHDYFVNLQMVTQVEPDARVLGSKIKRDDWTFEQDMVFEHAMAEFEETDPLRWLKVASLLPGKNHDDVRHRYQRLIYDVHKIENAMPMEVKYKSPKPGKSLLDKVAAKSSRGRVRGVSLGHRGGDRADDEGQRGGAKRGPKAKGPSRTAKERDVGSAGDGDEAPVNEGGSPAVRTEGKPLKIGKLAGKSGKIKGKGGAYLLSKSSTPRAAGGAALKRSAAHLANLKRARVDDDSLTPPSPNQGKRITEPSMRTRGRGEVDGRGRGGARGVGGGGGGGVGTGAGSDVGRRKSMRPRKRKQAESGKDDDETEDEHDGPHSRYHRR